MSKKHDDAGIAGIPPEEVGIMARLLRMSPTQHKAAPKTESVKGDAQRQRRLKEREAANSASGAS